MESSTFKGRGCFKYQGIVHIASDCPNKNIVTSVEEKIISEEDQNHEKVVELIQPNQGVSLIV